MSAGGNGSSGQYPTLRPFPKGVSGNPSGVSKEVAHVRRMLQEFAPEACVELIRLCTGAKDEKVRVAAIKELLDRVFGRPHVSVSVTGEMQASVVQVILGMTPEQRRDKAAELAFPADCQSARLDTPESPK